MGYAEIKITTLAILLRDGLLLQGPGEPRGCLWGARRELVWAKKKGHPFFFLVPQEERLQHSKAALSPLFLSPVDPNNLIPRAKFQTIKWRDSQLWQDGRLEGSALCPETGYKERGVCDLKSMIYDLPQNLKR